MKLGSIRRLVKTKEVLIRHLVSKLMVVQMFNLKDLLVIVIVIPFGSMY